MNNQVKVLVFDHEDNERVSCAKRLFLDGLNIFRTLGDVRWCAGLTMHPLHRGDSPYDVLLFSDGVDNYRKMGVDATFAKVLRHELQHVAQFRNELPTVEPPQAGALEYGVIPNSGITVPDFLFRPKPHAWHRTVLFDEFYTVAVDEFEIEAFQVFDGE